METPAESQIEIIEPEQEDPPPLKGNKNRCFVPGCNKYIGRCGCKGMCGPHYNDWKKRCQKK